jgi:hypothetical protein
MALLRPLVAGPGHAITGLRTIRDIRAFEISGPSEVSGPLEINGPF